MEKQSNQQDQVLEVAQEQELSFNEKLELANSLSRAHDDLIQERNKFGSFIFNKKVKIAEQKFIEAKNKFAESVGDLYTFVSKLRSMNEGTLANLLWYQFPELYFQRTKKQEGVKNNGNESVNTQKESDDVDLLNIGTASLAAATLMDSGESGVNEESQSRVEEPAFSGKGGESGGGGATGEY